MSSSAGRQVTEWQEVIRCKRCVMPLTRPDTAHVDGVCSACLSYERRATIDWASRHENLLRLLDRHHGRVMVPSSGGKDSTYQCLRLKELGADVTAVTARTCHLTDIGRRNIDNLARHVRTIEVVPNMTVRAKLNRLGLDLVGDISWPEHAAIFSTPFKVAADTGHTLLMYGECPQAEYGGPMGSEQATQMTRRWVTEFGGFLGLRPDDFVGMEGITERDMADYQPVAESVLLDDGIEAHFLGQYEAWDSHRNAAVAIRHGMRGHEDRSGKWHPPCHNNFWTAENVDNGQTGQHDFFMWLKYGFGRGCQQISVDVRSMRVTRDNALEWLDEHEHRDGEIDFHECYAGVELVEVLDRIDLSKHEYIKIVERFKC